MEPKQRIFLGCLGALTPVILNLLVVDLETTLMKATVFTFLGYLIRGISTMLRWWHGGISL